MGSDLKQEAKELLTTMGSLKTRQVLLEKGFLEEEIDAVLSQQTKQQQTTSEKNINRLLAKKESFDRLGYGFATPQFINILFYQTGAGLLVIGLANGLKTLLSLLLSTILTEFTKHHTVAKDTIAKAGLLYGFSFFLLAFATLAQLPSLFIVGFLLGAIGVVTYGELYRHLIHEIIKHEKKNHFLRKAAFYGVIISTISLLLSGLLIDKIPGIVITVFGLDFKVHGFLLSFMITAFALIASSFLTSKLQDTRKQRKHSFMSFLKEHHKTVKEKTKVFIKNPYIFLLLLPATISGVLQALGTSYYGIFIYQTFKNQFFGGFTNVAVLYSVALIISLLGPYFTRSIQKSTGLAPHLVFGTLLSAILPFILVKNPYFYAIMAALVCSVIGGAITGSAQGLIAQKIMDLKTRKAFYAVQSFIIALPYVIGIPIGAWIAQTKGLTMLFSVVGFGLVFAVVPLYFLLVAITNKMQL